jgi:hypothetical protein
MPYKTTAVPFLPEDIAAAHFMAEYRNSPSSRLIKEVLVKHGIDVYRAPAVSAEQLAGVFNELIGYHNFRGQLYTIGLAEAKLCQDDPRTLLRNKQRLAELYPATMKIIKYEVYRARMGGPATLVKDSVEEAPAYGTSPSGRYEVNENGEVFNRQRQELLFSAGLCLPGLLERQ